MSQILYDSRNCKFKILKLREQWGFNKIFFIAGTAFLYSDIPGFLEENGVLYTTYTDRTGIITEAEVKRVKDAFDASDCDVIMSVGGGSIIDLGKALSSEVPETVMHVAIPTTAGIGSEAHEYVLATQSNMAMTFVKTKRPDAVLLIDSLPNTLDDKKKKDTAIDFLSRAILSFLSNESTEDSLNYSRAAIRLFIRNCDGYVNAGISAQKMLRGSYFMGKAIGILMKNGSEWSLLGHLYGYDIVTAMLEKLEQLSINEQRNNLSKKEKSAVKELKSIFGVRRIEQIYSYFRGLLREYGLSDLCKKEISLEEEIHWKVYAAERKLGYELGKKPRLWESVNRQSELYVDRTDKGTKQFLKVLLNIRDNQNKEYIRDFHELMINLVGYADNDEASTINFENTIEHLGGIVCDNDDVMILYLEARRMLSEDNKGWIHIFGADSVNINKLVLDGLMIDMGYMAYHERFDEVSYVNGAYRTLLYWERAYNSFQNEKHEEYLQMLHVAQLDMMDEIDRVCKKNNLTYFLNYGSLLGAIRHKGYIPWDDDLDICMPREDYDKFREICNRDMRAPYYVYNNIDFNDCTFSMMKVMSKDTIFVRHDYRYGEDDGKRMFIDIWPLDNVPGPIPDVEKVKRLKSKYTGDLRIKVRKRCHDMLELDQKFKAFSLSLVSEKSLIKKRENAVTRWKNENTDYWLSGGVYNYIKETHPKKWYTPAVRLQYEDREYDFPHNYEALLRHFYGNYMQLPPLSKRFTHAPFKVQFGKDGEVMYFSPAAKRGGKNTSGKERIIRSLRKKYGIQGRKVLNFAIKSKGVLNTIGLARNTSERSLSRLYGLGTDKKCIVISHPELVNGTIADWVRNEKSDGAYIFAGVENMDILSRQNVLVDFFFSDLTKRPIVFSDKVLRENKSKLICIKNRSVDTNLEKKNIIRLNYIYYIDGGEKNENLMSYYKKNNGDGILDFMNEFVRYMNFDKVMYI